MDELQFQIRQATLIDLPQIIGILTKVGLPIEGLTGHIKNFFVAESNGDIVGVCGIEKLDEYGLLRSTAVVKSFRHQGIGRKLVETTVEYAREKGLKELYLLTPSKKDYFAYLGFEPVDRETAPPKIKETQEFTELCVDADCMRLVLLRDG